MYFTRRWAIEQCKAFFHLTDDDEQLIAGDAGRGFLLEMWETHGAGLYEHPLSLLRQEWYHAYMRQYMHPGFWDTVRPGGTVLEYGCGTGEVIRPWIQRGQRAVLAEPSHICQQYLLHKFAGMPAVLAAGDWADFGPYDGLVCVDVLEHLPNPMEVQLQLWDVLKPGGHALLKMDKAYPHAGHLAEAIRHYPEWLRWIRSVGDVLEAETYVWIRKKEA